MCGVCSLPEIKTPIKAVKYWSKGKEKVKSRLAAFLFLFEMIGNILLSL